MRRIRRGDDGAALVLALAFITIVAIGATALMTLADTGQRTTVAIRDQGYEVYSANGAVDQAISTVRANPGLGRHLGPCATVNATYNGIATSVECAGAPGSGAAAGGNANDANSPKNAILTLAPRGGEQGLVQGSNNELRITGPVVSNSGIDVPVSSATLRVDGQVSARDACSTNVLSTPAAACNLGPGAIANSADPGYGLHPAATPVSPPPPADPVQGCETPGQRLVVLSPGTYSSVSQLNAVFSRCTGSVFWFQPGFYYFDFTDSAARWEITGSSTQVVGGVRARWTPSAPSAGTARPLVPFPVDAVPATPLLPAVPAQLGGCVTSEESATTPGVQFAFGGTSRVFVQDAKVELCARGSATEQQIALYGLPPARDTTATVPTAPAPAQTTVTYRSVGTATTSGDPSFSSPANAQSEAPDSADAVATQNAPGSTATLQLPGFTGPPIPVGATVDRVVLRAVQQPVNGNVTSLSARVSNAAGTLVASVPKANGDCGASTVGLCTSQSPTAHDQRIPLSGVTAADLDGGRVTLDADLRITSEGGKTKTDVAGEVRVRYLALEITYTPAAATPAVPYRQLSGCSTTSLEAGGCALLETVGGPTAVSLHGTMYAPTGALRLELTSVGNQVLERGVIVRSARVKVTGSSTFLGSPIRLPVTSGTPANREVVFTARQGGTAVLRAVVRFDDLGLLSADRRADVTAWSVLR